MVAKPMAVLALAVVAMVAVACSSVATQQGSRPLAADAQLNEPTTTEVEIASPDAPDDPAVPDTDAIAVVERGGREVGLEPADVEPETATVATEPVIGSEPAVNPEPTVAPEPAATPEETPEPTPLPTPSPTATPAPVFVSPTPVGPIPSDNIVIEGPDVDESEAVSISDNGATACSLTESAIEFLDFGDASRTAATLQEASQFASQANEPEIASTAPGLAAAGTNEEAALGAIIATLNACAIHGYQV